MGQILILQETQEVSAMLSPGEAFTRAAGLDDLKRELGQQRFGAAIVDAGDRQPEALRLIAEADPDLAVVCVLNTPRNFPGNGSGDPWDAVVRPLAAETVRAAVLRARRHTAVLRENRLLRERTGQAAGDGAINGNGMSWIQNLPPRLDLRSLLSTVEKSVIQRTLEATRGAQAEAARRLGLSRSDLSYKLTKYELRKPLEPVS